jgi:DNA invertase Pin-like site-specific DNA recombinase
MHTAAYCRYSSDNQRDASILDQLRNITDYCRQQGWPDPALYKDEAISGALLSRAGLNQMLDAARHHRFDVLLIDDLTRLGRDMAETPRIIKMLKFAGIRVIGISDGVDTDRAGYKAEIGLRGIMGEMYLDDLAEKTHRGLTGQALSGKSAGGISYGYRSVAIDDGFTREIDAEQAKWIVFIFEQYAAGYSPRKIADWLNDKQVPAPRGGAWCQTAIYGNQKRGLGILANRMYNGEYIWNRSKWIKDPATGKRKRIENPESEWIINQVEQLRIVPRELWLRVQQRIQATRERTSRMRHHGRRRPGPGHGPKYLFSGLLECGCCGGNFIIVNRTSYGCARHKDRGTSVCTNKLLVRRTIVEDRLLTGIKQEMLNDANYRTFEQHVRQLLDQTRPDTGQAKRAIKDAEKEINNIMDAIRQGIITPSTRQALEESEQKLQQAKDQMAALQAYQPTQMLPRLRETYQRLVSELENIHDIPAARRAISEITGKIKLIPGEKGLTAEIQGAGNALDVQIKMVAGAGFEPTTFGL